MTLTSRSFSWPSAVRFLALAGLLAPIIAACGGDLGATVKRGLFTSKQYGVSSSPRVTNNPNPPHGGGRYQVGKPYTVAGKLYVPKEDPTYFATGHASWYGSDFHGRRTANGEIFSANAITGAHPTLPLPSYVRVTNQDNGRSIIVRINDRGPYMPGRVVDLSHRAALMLGYINNGEADVSVQYVGPAPLNGDDTRMLVASYSGPQNFDEGSTRFASAGNSNGTLVGMTGNFLSSLFSYADTTAEEQNIVIDNAHAAVTAMATRPNALTNWAAGVDVDARKLKLSLGVFTDQNRAIDLSEEFAMLGAVEEQGVTVNGRDATRLMMTELKPGATREDVLAKARELGLNDIVLY